MRAVLLCLALGTTFGGLARPFNEKRFQKKKHKNWIEKEVRREKACFFAEGAASYQYLKPQGYILGYTGGEMIASDGGWAPGLRLGAGIDIEQLGWQVDFEWSYSRSRPYQSFSAGSINSLINAASYTRVEQWLDMKVNRALMLWSCEIKLFEKCHLHPRVGTEAVWIHQRRHLRYSGPSTADSFGKNNFSGIGSSGGLGVEYILGRGFSWVGGGLFSLIWGKFTTFGDRTYNDEAVHPAVHLVSGLEWTYKKPNSYAKIGLAYEVHHYLAQGQARYGSPQIQPTNTDFNMSGPSLYARICF